MFSESLSSSSMMQRISLLHNLPLFSNFSKHELTELACLFHDVGYPADQIIVKENESVDSIYLVLQGEATVIRQNEVVAILRAGEAIGLSETGLFSDVGMRTATVSALTHVFLLRLDLADFKHFIDTHPDWAPGLQKATEKMLRMNFIKQIEPFSAIDPVFLNDLVDHIEEIAIPSNQVIFNQGDQADVCYLVCSGKIDILVRKSGDEDNAVVAVVKPGAILGELALLTDSKRNATAITTTPCRLLVLKKAEFQSLLRQAPHAYESITSLLMDRYRPIQIAGVTVHTRKDSSNNSIVILKNAALGKYYKTSEQGLFVWHLLDGDHTVQDIAIEYFYEYHQLATDDIGNLILNMMQSGFVQVPMLGSYVKQPPLPFWIRTLNYLRQVMEFEYSVKNVDHWVSHLYDKVGYLFYMRFAKIMMALVSVVGFITFLASTSMIGPTLHTTSYAWLLIVLVGPANLLTVPLHELAHALTTKAYGRQVHRFGVGWFWLGPIAFADTSDMWLSTRGPRLAVNLAGIYVNVVISGVLALIAWCLPYPVPAAFLWLVSLSGYLIAFYNLDPTFELDGYYVLMDALDKPNLRVSAINWLLHQRIWSLTFLPEIVYWLSCLLFIVLATALAYYIQAVVINPLFPASLGDVHPSHFKWVLPTIFLVLSFASLYAKLKQQSIR